MNVEALVAAVASAVIVAPWAWQRGRASGYSEGLSDRRNIINNVYGPGWESRLIAHAQCPKPSPRQSDGRPEKA